MDDNANGGDASAAGRYHRFLLQALTLIDHEDSHRQTLSSTIENDLNGLFADCLSQRIFETEQALESIQNRLFETQPVIFARLAGILAGYCKPEDDTLAAILRAVMRGYVEAETDLPAHEHEHDHDHPH